MLKKKDGKDSDETSISEKSQAGVIEQADEDPCDVLTAESGKC